MIGRLGTDQKRVLRVERRRVPHDPNLPVILVGTRLGEDFNPAIAELVVFGREGILVDANFANRRLRRKLAGGKSIDVNLSAIGAGGRSGERLEISLELVGSIG